MSIKFWQISKIAHSLLGHLANTGDWHVLLGQPQGVHDVHACRHCSPVVHAVRDVVEVEQPVHEVAADAKLGVRGVGVAHGCEQTRLQAVECVALLLAEVAATEEPSLALDCRLLAVAIGAQWEAAVRDEVWDEYLCGGRAEGVHARVVDVLHRVRDVGNRNRDTKREKRQNEEEERAPKVLWVRRGKGPAGRGLCRMAGSEMFPREARVSAA